MWDVGSDTACTHTHGAFIVFCFSMNCPSQGLLFVPFAASQPSAPVCQTRHKPSVLPLRAGRLITIFGEKNITLQGEKKNNKKPPWIACKEIKQNAIPPLLLSVLEPSKKFLSSSVRVSFYSSMTNTELASLNI